MEASKVVLWVAALCAASRGAPFPSEEDLYPCKCTPLAHRARIVTCARTDGSDLLRVFGALRGHPLQTLVLREVDLAEVDFGGMEISTLRVEKSRLTSSSRPAFAGLDDSLHVLNVADDSGIGNFSLACLHQLTELHIRNHRLGKVANRWLNEKIRNVERLVLEEDAISELEERCFQDLRRLRSVSLFRNSIRRVERSMFPRPALRLTHIDLSYNKITKLPYDFFFVMPRLSEIILSGNHLVTLEHATWTTVWEQLDAVCLLENPLACDDNLSWIGGLRWPAKVEGACLKPKQYLHKSLEEVYVGGSRRGVSPSQ